MKETKEEQTSIHKIHQTKRKSTAKLKKEGEMDQRKTSKDCFRCGLKHNLSVCWFKNKECFECDKTGHTKKMCKGSVKHMNGSESESRSESAHVQSKSDEEAHGVYSLKAEKIPPVLVDLVLSGRTVVLEVDTGSPFAVIGEASVKKAFDTYELQRSNVKLKSYNGHPVDIQGSVNVEVKYKGKKEKVKNVCDER